MWKRARFLHLQLSSFLARLQSHFQMHGVAQALWALLVEAAFLCRLMAAYQQGLLVVTAAALRAARPPPLCSVAESLQLVLAVVVEGPLLRVEARCGTQPQALAARTQSAFTSSTTDAGS